MTPVIKCHSRDFQMYYGDCYLQDSKGQLYLFLNDLYYHGVDDEDDEDFLDGDHYDYSVYVSPVNDVGGMAESILMAPDDLYAVILPPTYTPDGRWVGEYTERSYKRSSCCRGYYTSLAASVYYNKIQSQPESTGRITRKTFITPDYDGIRYIFHCGMVVGFLGVAGTAHIFGDVMAERMAKELENYNVIKC